MSTRHQAFCEAYLRLGNATAAAKEAGYSGPNVTKIASRLLTNPSICEELARLRGDYADVVATVADKVSTKLAPRALSPDQIISRMEVEKILSDYARGMEDAGHRERLKAIELLTKINGWQVTRTELSGPNGSPVQLEAVQQLSDTELEARLAELATKRLTE